RQVARHAAHGGERSRRLRRHVCRRAQRAGDRPRSVCRSRRGRGPRACRTRRTIRSDRGVKGMDERIRLNGSGNMGQALVRGWLARGIQPARLGIVDPAPAALAAAAELGIVAGASLDAVRFDDGVPDVVLLAVKPQQLDAVVRTCAAPLGPAPLYLSIAAGKPSSSIASALGPDANVVRAMPNTPAAVGRGMTVMVASPSVDARGQAVADELMSAVGTTAWVRDERLMDAVTAVSGSGPAYVFLLIECLAKAGAAAGLDA